MNLLLPLFLIIFLSSSLLSQIEIDTTILLKQSLIDSTKLEAYIYYLPTGDFRKEEYKSFFLEDIHSVSTHTKSIKPRKTTTVKQEIITIPKGVEDLGLFGNGMFFIFEQSKDSILTIPILKLKTNHFLKPFFELKDSLKSPFFNFNEKGLVIRFQELDKVFERIDYYTTTTIDGVKMQIVFSKKGTNLFVLHASLFPFNVNSIDFKEWLILYFLIREYDLFKYLNLKPNFTNESLKNELRILNQYIDLYLKNEK